MKEIYILLTHTGSILSSIVKFYTKEKYSHVSIGLDPELNELYSFGRLKPYNPYRGGLVKEELNAGTFKRFKNTMGAIYCLELEEEQYITIKKSIEYMYKNKEKYKFNTIGLFLVSINKKYKRENTFYCAEFVKYLLEKGFSKRLLPEIVKPMDILKLNNIELIYEGLINNYKVKMTAQNETTKCKEIVI